VIEGFKISSLQGKYVLFFFYPLDFTFVCPTELHAFEEKLREFKKRNCEVVGCSIDSHFSHLAWLTTPKSKGGIQGVSYPIVSDINKTISADYDVLVEGAGIAYPCSLSTRCRSLRSARFRQRGSGHRLDPTRAIDNSWTTQTLTDCLTPVSKSATLASPIAGTSEAA
jgi:peroxiredoxin